MDIWGVIIIILIIIYLIANIEATIFLAILVALMFGSCTIIKKIMFKCKNIMMIKFFQTLCNLIITIISFIVVAGGIDSIVSFESAILVLLVFIIFFAFLIRYGEAAFEFKMQEKEETKLFAEKEYLLSFLSDRIDKYNELSKYVSQYVNEIKNIIQLLNLLDICENFNISDKFNDFQYNTYLELKKELRENGADNVPEKIIDLLPWSDKLKNNLDEFILLKNKVEKSNNSMFIHDTYCVYFNDKSKGEEL